MDEEVRKRIEQIAAGMKCPKGFRCARSGFEELCKAKDVGLDGYLECLEKNARECPFALPFGYGHFCECPLRVYIAKKLDK
jgi:hypothetical protein